MDATTQIWIVTITNLELITWFLVWKECEILTHSQQQPQVPNDHKKKPTIRLTTRVTMLWTPKSPFYTGCWSQLRSSARHTTSNQQAQLKKMRWVNLTENAEKHTFKAPCCCLRMHQTLICCCLHNQCEY